MSVTINGNGTISGLAVGGLPDNCVTPSDLSSGGPRWTFYGTLGVGMAPSDWTAGTAIEIGQYGNAVWSSSVGDIEVLMNAYSNGIGWRYGNTGRASRYAQAGGEHQWYSASSGAANSNVAFFEYMVLDTSGNLTLQGPNTGFYHNIASGTFSIGTKSTTPMLFVTNSVERGRVDLSGAWTLGGNTLVDGTLTVNSTVTTAGNLAVAGTMRTSASGSKTVQLGTGTLESNGNLNVYLRANNYNDGTGVKFINNGSASVYQQGAGSHVWAAATGGTAGGTATLGTTMHLDANGNLGIGMTPNSWSPGRAINVNDPSGAFLYSVNSELGLGTNAYHDATNGHWYYAGNGYSANYAQYNGEHQWLSAPYQTTGFGTQFYYDQRMTLTQPGNLLLGSTAVLSGSNLSTGLQIVTSDWGIHVQETNTNANSGTGIQIQRVSTVGPMIQFAYGAGMGSTVGSIGYNGVLTNYNTTSDYRLKDVSGPMVGALERNARLQPKIGSWKRDGSPFEGFLAHELLEVFPQAGHGVKDAVDENGEPIYQQIGTGPLDAHFSACINELQAIIASMKAEIAELKGAK